MRMSLPPMARLDALAGRLLLLTLGAWLLLALAMLGVMSLGTDEAWVLNGLRSTMQEQVPGLSTSLIVTSGGLFALANAAVEWAGGPLWLHRLFSLAFLALAVVVVVRHAREPGDRPADLALLAVPWLVLPGAAEVGTAALGTSAGLLLLMLAIVAWTDPARSTGWRVLVTGLLYGLAAATRFDLVLFGAAILATSTLRWSAGDGPALRWHGPAWGAVALGLAVFLAHLALMGGLAVDGGPEGSLANATGLGAWGLNYPKLLNRWATLGSFIPVGVLALSSAAFFFSRGRAVHAGVPRLESLLLASGVVLLAGWVLRAPIPHLRYAWPALFCFAALASLGLAGLLRRFRAQGRAEALLWCRCVGVVLVAASLGTSLRSLVLADSDIVAWEWANETPHDYYRRFEAGAQQREAARYLSGLSPEATVYAHVPYAMRYLSRRPVFDIMELPGQGDGVHAERYLLLGPMVGAYLYLDADAWNWIAANGRLVAQFGRYSVYRLPAGGEAELLVLRLARTNFIGHPGAEPWFARGSLKP